MFDRIINILIVESDEHELNALLSYIYNPGHNVFIAKTLSETEALLNSKDFVIIFCSLDLKGISSEIILKTIHKNIATKNTTVIVTSVEDEKLIEAVGPTKYSGGSDYLTKPFISNLVKAKIGVYKKLHFKHQRVTHLLESILPAQILNDFSLYGKSSPKKKKNASIMFTDFVNFTQKTKNLDPSVLVKKLDFYFTKFDEIIQKYHLEKIKTIGDAYMAVGGVTEDAPNPILRTALAAIEIRNFMLTDISTEKALGRDFWEIRIGIHCGDLVAGVVGTHKFSFDVWGDAVNIASRCEDNSLPNQINISGDYYKNISQYFNCTPRGEIAIKNAGEIEMYFLEDIKADYSLYKEGRIPNVELRKIVKLPLADFEGIRTFIMTKLKAELDDKLKYHSWEHTETVEEAVIKYGELENLSEHELLLVRTAALFHDSGFLYKYENNEQLAVDLFNHLAPRYGYQKQDMKVIEEIIIATSYGAVPTNLLQAVMCDADLDYLGRIDYHVTAAKLFDEMALFVANMSEKERIEVQIDYLENIHKYYTNSAQNVRNPGKERRLEELRQIYRELIS